jgi:hypothetical protein
MSGTTFFTPGLGDLHPVRSIARLPPVGTARTGFVSFALENSAATVLYTAFSRREARITMLDQWAGSPPCAAVILRRAFESKDPNVIMPLLKDWETASAEILESHLSYPILCLFRSQHDNQSWLGSLVAILDACALVMVGVDDVDSFQARLTFAIGRHALVDLAQTFRLKPETPANPRLGAAAIVELRAWLETAGVELRKGAEADRKLEELCELYVPYALPLARALPHAAAPIPAATQGAHNWETTAWAKTAGDDAH